MPALLDSVLARRQSSHTIRTLDLSKCTIVPAEGALHLTDSEGDLGEFSHWSFGQLCAKLSTPAEYLRSLPEELATINLQWQLEHAPDIQPVQLMSRQNGHLTVAAMTSPTYGRIWDSEVAQAIVSHVDLEKWKIPAASYSATDPLRATTLYASDRDMFVFLVNEQAGVNADGEDLKRGVIIWNSEVGSATFGMATFLYDKVCDNRIIWGAREYRDLKMRHSAKAPDRFVAQAIPLLGAYAQSSTLQLESSIQAAKTKEIGKDKESVVEWLRGRKFAKGLAEEAYEIAESGASGGRQYNPRSVWGLVQGLTEAAHRIGHTNTRLDVESKAGALMDLV
jgi:hypothetical protein